MGARLTRPRLGPSSRCRSREMRQPETEQRKGRGPRIGFILAGIWSCCCCPCSNSETRTQWLKRRARARGPAWNLTCVGPTVERTSPQCSNNSSPPSLRPIGGSSGGNEGEPTGEWPTLHPVATLWRRLMVGFGDGMQSRECYGKVCSITDWNRRLRAKSGLLHWPIPSACWSSFGVSEATQ